MTLNFNKQMQIESAFRLFHYQIQQMNQSPQMLIWFAVKGFYLERKQ